MVLFDDVLQVLVLSHLDVEKVIILDTFNDRRIGTVFVDGDPLWHVMQVDGTFQKTPGRSLIPLGSEEKFNRVTGAVNRLLKVLPLTRNFYVTLIHSPIPPTLRLRRRKTAVIAGGILIAPAVHGRVVNENATPRHQFLNMAQASMDAPHTSARKLA